MNQSNALRRLIIGASLSLLASGCMSIMPLMAPTVQSEPNLSAAFPFESRFATVLGAKMHYVEQGAGTPVIFVHGNPTSSYLWRNVLPIVAESNRAIAVDLIGMGKSDKPDLAYTLDDQIRYFDGFMQSLNLKEAVLVVHDWGGPIGIDYALRHPTQIKSIVMMETLVRPMSWGDFEMGPKYMFRNFRDPEQGHKLIVKDNYFVEKLLPMMAGRKLSAAEMTAYRAPFLREADRKLVAKFPLEIPLDGSPQNNHARVLANYEALKRSSLPLLLLKPTPGAIMTTKIIAGLQKDLPRLVVKEIGPGLHFVQESQPSNIGHEIAAWVRTTP